MPKRGLIPDASSILLNLKPQIKGPLFYFLIFIAALPAFLIPIRNPDLFWGFSAARWMWIHHALPRFDFWSWSKPHAPWIDFEWLSQLMFLSLYKIGGWKALLLFKSSLLCLAWIPIEIGLRQKRVQTNLILGAFLLWAATSISHSDLRPELFSLIFFTWVLLALEIDWQNPAILNSKISWGFFGVFILWSNLHAGFILGEVLIFIYAFFRLLYREISELKKTILWGISAFLGTLLNPYGIGPYQVALMHLKEKNALNSIAEWSAFNFLPPSHWPTDAVFILLLLGLATILLSKPNQIELKKNSPIFCLVLFLSLLTLERRRIAPYFVITFLMGGGSWLNEIRIKEKYALNGSFIIALGSIFFIWSFWTPSIQNFPFDGRLFPEKATTFISQHNSLSKLRFYNPWEWGGYLAWKLRPQFKVYCDGRYLFHDLLLEQKKALSNPQNWRKFLDSQKIDAALIPHLKQSSPWYSLLMPKSKWTLVYEDPTALLFVRKNYASRP